MKRQFIQLCKVSLDYKSKEGKIIKALQDVNLNISKGDFVGIVGPSGCGKSTLLKIIAGLITPTTGEVIVDGKKVVGPLKNVGFAFQNPLLLPWRTIIDNVCLPFEIIPQNKGYDKKKIVGLAKELLKMVGLEDFKNKYPWELSGGMQQRASLCRALIHNPEILLLDEPFGALDVFTREELWLATEKLWNSRKCTVIFVTHDIREAIFLSNVVFVMSSRPGRIIHTEEIRIPRPRNLDVSYTKDFSNIFKRIRHMIGKG